MRTPVMACAASAPGAPSKSMAEAKQAAKEATSYRGSYVPTVHHLPPSEAEGKTPTLRGRAMCSVG